ncbi:MAG: LysR family transcriptional regulator [Neptuniibacter sp.]
MELRQLKYFEAVARTLNFSRAAEELHIAQPPLSRQIQNLEDELGVLLLDRSYRPMKLTNAGSFFYEQAVQLLAKVHEVKKTTKRLSEEGKRWMGIGFVPSILYSQIPSFIQSWCSSHSYIDASLFEQTSVVQAEALKSGKIDVGISRLAIEDPGITNILLNEEPMVLAVSSVNELAGFDEIDLAIISNQTLILYPAKPRPSFADHVMRQFQVRGLTVKKTYEANGVQSAIGFAAAGMGVAIVPESVQVLQRKDITYIPIKDEGVTTPLIMSIRENDDSAHLQDFISFITESVQKGNHF